MTSHKDLERGLLACAERWIDIEEKRATVAAASSAGSMHTEHVPEDRTEQIILYVRLYQEQQRVSTPPHRQEQIARITARIISTVFGPHPDVFLGSHARMMAEYAKIADMLPRRTEDRSA